MSQPERTAASPLANAPSPTHRNHLTIAHILLWTAGTGIALTYLQAQKPPPPESIGFASILTGLNEDPKIKLAELQQGVWRLFHARYVVGLFFAPVYGAALAGGLLAIGRFATRQFGFPVQPGHWLLLVIASLFVLFIVHPLLRRLPISSHGADCVGAMYMTSVLVAVTVLVREPLYWRCPLGLAAVGSLLLVAGFSAGFISPSFELSPLFPLGIGAIIAVPFAALVCLALDIADRSRRYDYLHWTGVATLLGVALQYFVIGGMSWYFRP